MAALLLTACGDDTPTGSPSPAATSEPASEPAPTETPTLDTFGTLADLVPPDRRDAELVLGFPDGNPSPLMGHPDDGEADGALPDLMNAAIDLLGLSGRYEAVPQNQALDLLEAEDLHAYVALSTGVRGIADRTDAVTFLDEEETFLVRDGLDVGSEASDLCGLRVGYNDGSSDAAMLAEMSAACVGVHGLEPIDVQEFTDEAHTARDAVIAGEVDATSTGSFYGEWLISQHPGLSLGGPILGESYWAILVGKANGLVEPLAAAIDELVANGTYERIMTEHGLPNMPPMPARVNPT